MRSVRPSMPRYLKNQLSLACGQLRDSPSSAIFQPIFQNRLDLRVSPNQLVKVVARVTGVPTCHKRPCECFDFFARIRRQHRQPLRQRLFAFRVCLADRIANKALERLLFGQPLAVRRFRLPSHKGDGQAVSRFDIAFRSDRSAGNFCTR